MNFFQSLVLLSVFVALSLAGHVHHKQSQGDGAVAVHYSVVTEHKFQDGGHKGHEGHMGHEMQYSHGEHKGHEGHLGYEMQHGHGGHIGHEGHMGHEVQHGHGGHKGHEGHHDYTGHHSASQHAWGHDEALNAASHDGSHNAGHDGGHHDHHAYPKYDFSYGIKDPKTGDIKSHKEIRDGDSVKGSYTIKEADGTTRHVEYTADKHTGFNAVVHTTGHAHTHADAAKEHDHGSHDHGYGHAHGQASSFIMFKKQEERKH